MQTVKNTIKNQPKTNTGMPIFRLRLSSDDRTLLEAAASRVGLTLSAYLRQAALKEARSSIERNQS